MQPKDLLKHYRQALNLKQSEAADRCGVSFSAYEKWERGAAPINAPTLAGCLLFLGAPAAVAREAGQSLVLAAH